MKNKTLAVWLSFVAGPLGLHRFYLRGFGDLLGWFLPIPTAIGLALGWVRWRSGSVLPGMLLATLQNKSKRLRG